MSEANRPAQSKDPLFQCAASGLKGCSYSKFTAASPAAAK